jgi:acyl-CoA thioesterase FadM
MYRLRFIYVMLKSVLSAKRGLLDDFVLHFRAIPLIDTDFSRLFTQTYALYMGLARWNLLFNSEFRTAALKKGWVPVTTAETMTYSRSVKAFDKVKLVTRIIYWDDRRFYIEHVFYVREQVCARTYVEGLIRSPKGPLKSGEAFAMLGVDRESPAMPDKLQGWIDMIAR